MSKRSDVTGQDIALTLLGGVRKWIKNKEEESARVAQKKRDAEAASQAQRDFATRAASYQQAAEEKERLEASERAKEHEARMKAARDRIDERKRKEKEAEEAQRCPTCKGSGTINDRWIEDQGPVWDTCSSCGGSGRR